jgi:hypothetical protein
MVLFYLIASKPHHSESDLGIQLFTSLHTLLLLLICSLVPAVTADCIAREKRDETLGLLFLTPLTADGIVVGKSAAQVFRIALRRRKHSNPDGVESLNLFAPIRLWQRKSMVRRPFFGLFVGDFDSKE